MAYAFCRACLAGAAFLLLSTFPAAAQGQWTGAFQTSATEPAEVLDAVTDPVTGDTWVTGRFSGTAVFGSFSLVAGSNDDVFVARRSAAGQWRWATQGSGGGADSGIGLAVDAAGNAYVSGIYEGTATFGTITLPSSGLISGFVGRLDPQGNWQWVTRISGNSTSISICYRVALLPAGDVVVAGIFMGRAGFGATTLNSSGQNSLDGFVARLTGATGLWQWAQPVSGGGDDAVIGMATDPAGNVYAAGNFVGTVAFGSQTLTSVGADADGFVGKMDATGTWQWATPLAGVDEDMLMGVVTDGLHVYAGGWFNRTATVGSQTISSAGAADVVVLELDQLGAVTGVATGGGADEDQCIDLIALGGGGVAVAGFFTTAGQFDGTLLLGGGGSDVLLAACRPASPTPWMWAVSAPGSGDDLANTVTASAATPAGARTYTIGGAFESPFLSFGSTTLSSTLTNPGDGSAFLASWLDQPVGVGEEENAGGFTLQPNPARGLVRLTGAPAGPITLLDALGRTARVYPQPEGQAAQPLDLKGIPPGLYLLRAGGQMQRLVVE